MYVCAFISRVFFFIERRKKLNLWIVIKERLESRNIITFTLYNYIFIKCGQFESIFVTETFCYKRAMAKNNVKR